MWNVPYARNPFFTGREDFLTRLEEALRPGKATVLSQPQAQAIDGLGGIGKTQIAVEYAYRHRQDYQDVLWVLADTRESLLSGYAEIASLLRLIRSDEQDQTLVLPIVLQWLKTHIGWLLILDNADELDIVREFLPPTFNGHILLTSRARSLGDMAHSMQVEVMDEQAGALLLLRRAHLVAKDAPLESASSSDIALAKSISNELGGLPLALDQAGAYIEEIPCSLSQYQSRYRTRRNDLLRERGSLMQHHPEPVATTWSLSFQRVEERDQAAADLLRFCAHLAPDALPEAVILAGADQLGPRLQQLADDPLAFDKAMATLGAYSLITREPATETMRMHRLVQAMLIEELSESDKTQWAERIVCAIDTAQPWVEHENWPQWEQILPHALACVQLIEQHDISSAEAARLLQQTGWYLTERARYREAEPLLRRALQISEHIQGTEHIESARDASTLAYLYQRQGKYEEAEPLYERALRIREQQLGGEHPDTAGSLNNLAGLYQSQGKYEEAEPLYQRALKIFEQKLGAEHPNTQTVAKNYALFLQMKAKPEEQEG